jgi:dual specificity tyrosine-phosphorylation-regulated kinase 2/3/4
MQNLKKILDVNNLTSPVKKHNSIKSIESFDNTKSLQYRENFKSKNLTLSLKEGYNSNKLNSATKNNIIGNLSTPQNKQSNVKFNKYINSVKEEKIQKRISITNKTHVSASQSNIFEREKNGFALSGTGEKTKSKIANYSSFKSSKTEKIINLNKTTPKRSNLVSNSIVNTLHSSVSLRLNTDENEKLDTIKEVIKKEKEKFDKEKDKDRHYIKINYLNTDSELEYCNKKTVSDNLINNMTIPNFTDLNSPRHAPINAKTHLKQTSTLSQPPNHKLQFSLNKAKSLKINPFSTIHVTNSINLLNNFKASNPRNFSITHSQENSINQRAGLNLKNTSYSLDYTLNGSIIDKDFILCNYQKILRKSEMEEIRNLDEVYFLGEIQKKIKKKNTNNYSPNKSITYKKLFEYVKYSRPGSKMNLTYITNNEDQQNMSSTGANVNNHKPEEDHVYDDEEGNYILRVGDHINYRYEILTELGRGSFGQAIKCFDYKTKSNVCVKMLKSKKKFQRQAKIEIKILEFIKAQEGQCPKEKSNVVRIIEHFVFRNHICIVFELLGINLYEMIRNGDFKGIELPVIKKIGIQLLQNLIFLNKHKIIHCDLKPENILLTDTGVKVIDFGSSCFENEKLYTYIQSRFYRAPEIILGLPYGCEIDMWSFGCILVELYTAFPIFPGEDEKDQLNYIMEYQGVPPFELIIKSRKKSSFFEVDNSPICRPNSKGKIRRPNTKKLSKLLKGADEGFIDLITKCLEWDPNKRIKPIDALLHPWIAVDLPKEILKYHRDIKKMCRIDTEINTRRSLNQGTLFPSGTQTEKASSIKYKSIIHTERKMSNKNTLQSGNTTNRGGLSITSSILNTKRTQEKNTKNTFTSDKKILTSVKSRYNITLDLLSNSAADKKIKNNLVNTTTNRTKPRIIFN